MPQKKTARLDSIRACRQEMAKVYRGVVNGRIHIEDGPRLVFMLREIRATLELEPIPTDMPQSVHITVRGVPSGVHFTAEEVAAQRAAELPPLPEPPPGRSMPMLKLIEHDADEMPPPGASAGRPARPRDRT